jgi:hypothetical protein
MHSQPYAQHPLDRFGCKKPTHKHYRVCLAQGMAANPIDFAMAAEPGNESCFRAAFFMIG